MNNRMLKYLLKNNPDKVISKHGIQIRQYINPLFRKIMMLSTSGKLKIIKKASTPKEQKVIYAGTHGFHDDIIFSIKTADKHVYLLYGSLLDFYNSFHGYGLWTNGVIIVDRKNKLSRESAVNKIAYAIDSGVNVLMFPEATWNKNPGIPVQKLYRGVYEAALKSHALVVPIATVLDGDTCYSIQGEAYDITKLDDEKINLVLETQIKKIKKAIDLLIYNTKEQADLKTLLELLLQTITLESPDTISIEALDENYKTLLTNIIKILNEQDIISLSLEEKLKLSDMISAYLRLLIINTSNYLKEPTVKENELYISILTRVANLLKVASRQKSRVAVDGLRDKLTAMVWNLYTPAKREEFPPKYWENFINNQIDSTKGLYDHEIEDVAEYKDPDEITENEVFSILDDILITKENAKIISLTSNKHIS